MEGPTSGSSPPVDNTAVNHIKGLNISWVNCHGGKILLAASKFSFPSMVFPNMLSMWFCGDISKNIRPYRMLLCKDVNKVKGEKKPVKYENLSETCHESGGNSKLELFGCEFLVPK